jgi:hypothetical protein
LKTYFGITTDLYDVVIRNAIGKEWFEKWKRDERIDINSLIELLDSEDMKGYTEDIGVKISDNYHKGIRDELYKYYDRRDYYVLMYYCNKGFFREDKCVYCSANGSREHYVDVCDHFQEKRDMLIGCVRMNCFREGFTGKKLSEMIEALYYRPSSDKKVRRKERDMIKLFASKVLWRERE